MFIVLLRFSNNKSQAGELMGAHNEWIARGMAEGMFVLVGSLQPRVGGLLLAYNTTRSELEMRMGEDPFVASDVVSVEVLEVAPSKADARLAFLLG